ncbi:helix-turn-helix transcriptional regulator [Haloferax sulfurifontis]|uniref:Transcriptional regulator n=1 Tax=Haloferax sulfurifontis ATCC BAA-897 TaxID=662480 RepID=M0HXZ7_9EURY|nr:helix-turn-helix domain-containing protein [Haloferax sulfurifontis]ELZ89381.1 transcriptional regulator [Haloferax sulfurifontis ATCC BAA-897]
MDGVVDELRCLVTSPNRLAALRALDEGPATAGELQATLDTSRSTVWRVMKSLSERGWVAKSGEEYEITPLGVVVVEQLQSAISTVEAATAFAESDLLRWLPRDDFGFNLGALASATVVAPTPSDPQAPLRLAVSHVESADRIRILTHAASPDVLATIHRRRNDDIDVEVVMTDGAYEAMARSEKTARQLADLFDAPGISLYRYERVPYVLSILDADRVGMGVVDDHGRPRAVLDAEADAVVDWARSTYTRYRAEATPADRDAFL